ncbi:MAG: hypothetical protein VYC11_03515 [Candidatus Thermoplasmatota archaeon]|nr:hypothetical protein [Euryarchaeota archaeon]MEC9090420.1 hypothetical protein [Candidatus Thermoplasmatota archaeon]MED5486560.1 hypothetical protein [Candidatus Thermoplasmatota archaeon]
MNELTRREKRYYSHERSYSIIRRMRWISLIIGPFPILWDNFLRPLLTRMGVPEIVTMEDMIQVLLFEFLSLDKWISPEDFEKLWPHINSIFTVLFLVFTVWAFFQKKATKKAAKELHLMESRGGFGRV